MYRNRDHSYYSRRAAEEMERGDQAADATAAAIHYDLAHRYSMLAARPTAGIPELTLVNGGKKSSAETHGSASELRTLSQ